MHHKLKWNVAKETEKCEEVTKNLVKIKNSLMLQQKIALRENVFPSRFLLSVCVCSFECSELHFYLLKRTRSHKEKELGQKLETLSGKH
jgi:hypothetical protein